MKTLLFVLASVVAYAQNPTGISPKQVKPPTFTAVLVCAPAGLAPIVCDYARLDPSIVITFDAQSGLTIKAVTGGGPTITFIDHEVPSGLLNGVNASFQLAATPNGAAHIYRNGLLLKPGVDYTIVGPSITFGPNPVSIPQPGDLLLANYRK